MDATTRRRRRGRARTRVRRETRGVIALGVHTPLPDSTSKPARFASHPPFSLPSSNQRKQLDKLQRRLKPSTDCPPRPGSEEVRKDVPSTPSPLDLIIPKGDTDAFEGPSTLPPASVSSTPRRPGSPPPTPDPIHLHRHLVSIPTAVDRGKQWLLLQIC